MLLALLVATCLREPPAAEHAKITLDVIAPSGRETAFMDQTPPETGKNPRPIVHAKVGEKIRVEYLFENIYPHKTIPDVVVHFYVARLSEGDGDTLPDLSDPDMLLLETAFDMDFRPGGRAGGRTGLTISEPGTYLVRVESRNTGSDHEHFAAIDLIVSDD